MSVNSNTCDHYLPVTGSLFETGHSDMSAIFSHRVKAFEQNTHYKKQLLSLLAADFVNLKEVDPCSSCLTAFFAAIMQMKRKDNELVNILGRSISETIKRKLLDETLGLTWLNQLYNETDASETKYWLARYISDQKSLTAYNQLAALVLDKDGDFVAQQLISNLYKMDFALEVPELIKSMRIRINMFPLRSENSQTFLKVMVQFQK